MKKVRSYADFCSQDFWANRYSHKNKQRSTIHKNLQIPLVQIESAKQQQEKKRK